VNTMNRKGKVKQTRLSTGKRPDQKRAVVKLAAGDSIEIFEAKGP
jgi:large subunit ribosomal protein L23